MIGPHAGEFHVVGVLRFEEPFFERLVEAGLAVVPIPVPDQYVDAAVFAEFVVDLPGRFSRRFNEEQAYVLKLVVSMIPIGIVGLLLKDQLNALLEAPCILAVVGAMLLLTAALLAFAYYAKPRQKETISYRDAFVIGLAQACAAMPGLSRSGSTIATGLLLGNKKTAVAQFSFLMVLAPILGETLLEAASGELTAGVAAGPLVAGFAASFLTGCLACRFMLEIVKRGRLICFAAYCAAAGIVSISSYLIR